MTQYPHAESAQKRTSDQIAKEYQEVCIAYGDLSTQIIFMQKDLDLIRNKMVQLMEEAAQLSAGDDNAKKDV